MIKTLTTSTLVLLLMGASSLAIAGEKQQKTRAALDAMAKKTIQKLVTRNDNAKELYEKSYGYAVFNNLKAAILLTSARGKGVAVHRESDRRIYMNMVSLGVNVGAGIQKMQVVFLFQNKKAFDNFVNSGWRAETAADLAVARRGKTATIEFRNGIAVYQFTDKGLMAQANISGTKYNVVKKLNKGVENPYPRNNQQKSQ